MVFLKQIQNREPGAEKKKTPKNVVNLKIEEQNMKPRKDVDSADAALTFRSILWALPYLALIGLFLGYAAGGALGALAGLLAATAVSVMIGSATTIFTGVLGGGAINRLYGTGRRTIGVRERLSGDLNVVRYHKLCNRFDEALIKIEEVLARDPDFAEALFLKAQLLWEGFEDREAARKCLLKIIKVEPDKRAVFHRWALNLYHEISGKRAGEHLQH
jgi:tetratricopeptide (TPR) repeat protein